MQFRPFTFLVLIAIGATAQAASFNCAAAREPSEVRVCANPVLGALDEQLAKVYRDAAERTPDIKARQRAWLKSRNTCADDVCIQTHYEQRIQELSPAQVQPQEATAPGSPGIQDSASLAALPAVPASVAPIPSAQTEARPEPAATQQAGALASEAPPAIPSLAPVEAVTNTSFGSESPEVTGGLALTIIGEIRENYAYILLALAAATAGAVYGYSKRCPKCEKWFSADEVDNELLSSKTGFKTVTRQDQHRDSQGKTIKTVERKEQVQVEVSTWKDFYKCKSCGHEWTGVSQTERT